jgi:hypothetical protein
VAPTLAADKVSLRLNWLLSGVHSIFYLGVEKGFYKDAGIDLTIGEGQGSARTVQVVATGGDTFGLVDGGSVIAGASHGAPVKSVLSIMNTSPYGISFLADSGVKTIKDVEGKTLRIALDAGLGREGVGTAKRAYDLAQQEAEDGVGTLAVAIRARGKVVGTMSVAAPLTRLPEVRIAEILPMLCAAADNMAIAWKSA